jgi:hypothetical protein
MAIYKDPSQPIQLRIEAAGKAIAYEKAEAAGSGDERRAKD